MTYWQLLNKKDLSLHQHKPYNPHTKYGRRKLREQAVQNYENMTPAKRNEYDSWKAGCIIIIILTALIIAAITGNWSGFARWMTR